MTSTSQIGSDSTMRQVLESYPGAQRALFRHFHIGGCSSCAFSPDETLGQVCARNGGLAVGEVIEKVRASHEQDAKIFLTAAKAEEWRRRDPAVRLVDVRSREEFEAVHLDGSVLLSQVVMREILSDGVNTRPLILIDHQGRTALDAAAYFMGHGLQNVHCVKGGIDAWARELDPNIKRYRLES